MKHVHVHGIIAQCLIVLNGGVCLNLEQRATTIKGKGKYFLPIRIYTCNNCNGRYIEKPPKLNYVSMSVF